MPDSAPPPTEELRWQRVGERPSARLRVVQETIPFVVRDREARSRLPSADVSFDRVPTPTAQLPSASAWAARLAMAMLEVAGGARPAPQIMRYCSAAVYESLVRRQSRAVVAGGAGRHPITVRRVRICEVRDGVVEAAVLVVDRHRIRPMALRLDGLDGRWIVTALEIG